MQFTITQGINNSTLIRCKSSKNIDLANAVKIFKHFPKNKKQTIILSDLSLITDDINSSKNKIRIISVCKKDKVKRATNIDFYDNVNDLIKKIDSNKTNTDGNFFCDENILIIENVVIIYIKVCILW